MTDAAAAARDTDKIKHTSKLLGFFAGAALAVGGAIALVALGVITVGTGGLALGAIAAIAAAGGAAGLGVATIVDLIKEEPGVKTGNIANGSPTILINRLNATAVLLGQELCYFMIVYNHGNKPIVEGSGTVFFHCRPAARKGDHLLCDANIATGSPNVLIGGPAVRVKGTRRSWVDTFLDYSSLYMTVVFGVESFLVSATLLGISEAVSYQMHLNNRSSIETAAVSATITSGGSAAVTAYNNNSIHINNIRTEQLAIEQHNATKNIIQDAMYQSYVARQTKTKLPIAGMTEWSKNNRVIWAFNRRTPPFTPPKPKPPGSYHLKQLGAQLGVDFIRLWREVGRENAVAEILMKGISCGDTSWLEPA